MEGQPSRPHLERLKTGVGGLDRALGGGLPKGRPVLITGETGTGKSVLLQEFIYRGITEYGQPGVLVACEETPENIRDNVASFGWDFAALEGAGTGQLALLDAAPFKGELEMVEADQHYSLTPLVETIARTVEQIGAERVAIDGLDSLFERFRSERAVRQMFLMLTQHLADLGVTTLLSAPTSGGRSVLSEHGLEQFVADGIIDLWQLPGELRMVRKLSIRKLRGLDYQSGIVEFQINSHGLEVFPRIPLKSGMAPELLKGRKSSGIARLDELLGGGFPEGHMVLISGGTGSGKTVVGLQFITAGLAAGEPAVMLTIEESREQLLHEARTFGWDLDTPHRENRLVFVDVPFSGMRVDRILYEIVNKVHEVGAKRLVMDSISALISAGATQREVRLFLEQLVSFCKSEGITAILTYAISGAFGAAAGQLLGGSAITEARLSSIVDAIILLNYVEQPDRVDKLMSVLKVRGSRHDPGIFRFEITDKGIELGERVPSQ